MIPAAWLAWIAGAKWWIYGALAVALVGLTVWILDTQFDRGYVAGKADGDAAIAKASEESLRQRAADEQAYRALSEKFARLDHELAKRETAAAVVTVERVRTVKEILHGNPAFGAVARPDALSSVRDADLARIRAAADATNVPANSAPRLPAAGTAKR